MTPETRLKISSGHLLLPVSGLDNRLFSRETMARAVGSIARTVGGRVVSNNGKRYVHCLKEINIDLVSGDRLGLIGHNGAGKTSLLKVCAGIYPLSSGHAASEGGISTFLSQSTGSNPEMTAVDFLEMQCIIRDYDKKQTRAFIERVLDFIELGEFAFMPIRTYSSGMGARLFASAALFFPCDILLIDEGIGAGDSQFKDKFHAKLQQFFQTAKIMVLASHNRQLLEEWCNQAIVMNKGEIVYRGGIADALDYYDTSITEAPKS